MADNAQKEVVVYADPMGNIKRVNIAGTELDVDSANVFMQGGKVGLTLSITGVAVRSETVPVAGTQAG